MARDKLPSKSSAADINAFLNAVERAPRRVKGGKRGRLLFAMDATASREPTWDLACHIQASMFSETSNLGGLELSLCYYGGFGKFKATGWLSDSASLSAAMAKVRCEGGLTQITRVLRHAVTQAKQQPIDAVVFVGDCMEEEIDPLCHHAGELSLLGVPVFMFHEGSDPVAAKAFREVARLTSGAYSRFDLSSAQTLRDLLSAVAVFAAGGRKALRDFESSHHRKMLQLSHQLGKR